MKPRVRSDRHPACRSRRHLCRPARNETPVMTSHLQSKHPAGSRVLRQAGKPAATARAATAVTSLCSRTRVDRDGLFQFGLRFDFPFRLRKAIQPDLRSRLGAWSAAVLGRSTVIRGRSAAVLGRRNSPQPKVWGLSCAVPSSTLLRPGTGALRAIRLPQPRQLPKGALGRRFRLPVAIHGCQLTSLP